MYLYLVQCIAVDALWWYNTADTTAVSLTLHRDVELVAALEVGVGDAGDTPELLAVVVRPRLESRVRLQVKHVIVIVIASQSHGRFD